MNVYLTLNTDELRRWFFTRGYSKNMAAGSMTPDTPHLKLCWSMNCLIYLKGGAGKHTGNYEAVPHLATWKEIINKGNYSLS